MTIRPLYALVLFFAVSDSLALSCPKLDATDLVVAVENAYNRSDLVFVGSVQESEQFEGHAPEMFVRAKWKGPEVLSIRMHWQSWSPRDSRVFFAARSDEPLGWSDEYPVCFPQTSDMGIEQILTEQLGEPVPVDDEAISRTYATFLVVLLVATGGVGVFAWKSLMGLRA